MQDKWAGKYRISEAKYGDNSTKYILEHYVVSKGAWEMYDSYDDLEAAERYAQFLFNNTIIETKVIST